MRLRNGASGRFRSVNKARGDNAYDPEKWTGFAFGLGMDRLAMILFDIPDIRLFAQNRSALSLQPIRMKFSVNWLREFVELPENPEELAELLTLAGIEIEKHRNARREHRQRDRCADQRSSRHPNADRLSVCQVDDGSGTKRQIVCGAKNYKVGDKVPLALPGANLPNGLRFKKQTARCRIAKECFAAQSSSASAKMRPDC